MKSFKRVLFLMVALVMLGTSAVGANTLIRNITGQERADFSIVLNGVKTPMKDAGGKVIHPVIIGGSTYVPLRSIAEMTGADVGYDGAKKEISVDVNDGTFRPSKDWAFAPNLQPSAEYPSLSSSADVSVQYNRAIQLGLSSYRLEIETYENNEYKKFTAYVFTDADQDEFVKSFEISSSVSSKDLLTAREVKNRSFVNNGRDGSADFRTRLDVSSSPNYVYFTTNTMLFSIYDGNGMKLR